MATFFRYPTDKKVVNFEYFYRIKGSDELQGPIRGFEEVKRHVKIQADISSDDYEILGRGKDENFVVGVFSQEEDASFSKDPIIREAYEKSLTESLGLKDRMLADFDPAMIDGMAKMAAALTYFAGQFRKIERKDPGLSYKILQKVYTDSDDYNIFRTNKSPIEMCWVFKSWLNEQNSKFKVIKDIHGIGSPDNSSLVKKSTPNFSLLLDDVHILLPVYPLAIGELPSGEKFLVIVENAERSYQVDPTTLVIIAPGNAVLQQAVNLVEEEFARLDVCKNKIVLLNGSTTIVKSQFDTTTWKDIVPIPLLQTEMDFLRDSVLRQDLLKKEGLNLKRGVLISGCPGVGKSVSIRCLCNELVGQVTILVVEKVSSIRAIYEQAKALSPCIVIFEDIDLITENRDISYYNNTKDNLMADLLGVLSGSMEYKDIITIATTNHPEKIDAALAKRPGRFDIHIKVPELDLETKHAILKLYLKKYSVPEDLSAQVLNSLEDSLKGYKLVGAHLEDYVKTSVKRAVVQGRPMNFSDFMESADVLKSISDEQKRLSKIGINS